MLNANNMQSVAIRTARLWNLFMIRLKAFALPAHSEKVYPTGCEPNHEQHGLLLIGYFEGAHFSCWDKTNMSTSRLCDSVSPVISMYNWIKPSSPTRVAALPSLPGSKF